MCEAHRVSLQIGTAVVRRTLHPDGRFGSVQSGRVAGDDGAGLRLWVAAGSRTMRRVDLSGRPVRHLPWAQELHTPTMLAPHEWGPYDTLMLMPPGGDHSVWWSWTADGEFAGWYVNLERTGARWGGGIDVHDLTLDLLVSPDGSVRVKDADEFAVQTGDPHFWDDAQGRDIHAQADRLTELASAQQFPFDGRWCAVEEFRPLGTGELPWFWDCQPDRPTVPVPPSGAAAPDSLPRPRRCPEGLCPF